MVRTQSRCSCFESRNIILADTVTSHGTAKTMESPGGWTAIYAINRNALSNIGSDLGVIFGIADGYGDIASHSSLK